MLQSKCLASEALVLHADVCLPCSRQGIGQEPRGKQLPRANLHAAGETFTCTIQLQMRLIHPITGQLHTFVAMIYLCTWLSVAPKSLPTNLGSFSTMMTNLKIRCVMAHMSLHVSRCCYLCFTTN